MSLPSNHPPQLNASYISGYGRLGCPCDYKSSRSQQRYNEIPIASERIPLSSGDGSGCQRWGTFAHNRCTYILDGRGVGGVPSGRGRSASYGD
jgi:hypothetical protein